MNLDPTTSAASLVSDISRAGRRALARRVGQVVSTLDDGPEPLGLDDGLRRLEELLSGHDHSRYWLAVSAIRGRLATEEEVQELSRVSRVRGPREALRTAVRDLARQVADAGDVLPEVEILDGAVTMDVSHTSRVTFTSGIQRVVRECVHRWCLHPKVRLVAWTEDFDMLRPLTAAEWENVTLGRPLPDGHGDVDTVVIPWRGTHVQPELAVDPKRQLKLAAIARYAPVTFSVIGYDVIPLTTPLSVTNGMVGLFMRHLAGLAFADRVAVISAAAAEEFRGWSAMLAGRGQSGPAIATVPLPVHAQSTTDAQIEDARSHLMFGAMPLVLVVGSHEPRKNHLAVLHAAELLWREGHRFSMAFVGSGSWKAEAFYERIAELQAAGRPLQSISGLSDDLLWAAYRLAHCLVFPSLNEGFGLPVAEALACGTPVVTSNFGSMAEIVAPAGEPLGGILVDPHDDADIARAIRSLLVDEDLHARLSREALTHRLGTWDEYATVVWDYLVEAREPQTV